MTDDVARPTPPPVEVRLLALADALAVDLDGRAVAVADRVMLELDQGGSGERRAPGRRARRGHRPAGPAGPWSRRRQLAIAAAVVIAIVAGTLVASPRARRAVGDLLGVRGVVIRQGPPAPTTTATATATATATSAVPGRTTVDRPPDATSTSTGFPPTTTTSSASLSPLQDLFLGTPVADQREAASRVRFALRTLDPAVAGAPTRSAVLATPAGGIVSFVYEPRDRPTILFTQFEATIDQSVFQKLLPEGATVTPAAVGGRPGLWIDGPVHRVGYTLPDGDLDVQELRLAGPTLLWTVGTVTYRIEGVATQAGAVALAEGMVVVPGR